MSQLAKKIIEEVVNMTRNLPKSDEGLQEAMGDAETAVDALINPYKEKHEIVCRKLADFTPGGSEFHNDPENCMRFIRESLDADRKLIKQMMRRINGSRRLRRLWGKAARREARRARIS